MRNFLLKLKRAWFETIRSHRLTRIVQDLNNYLTEVEVKEGIPANVENVLVISPHPDDESIGCGGTIALMVEAGANVDILYVTAGAPAFKPEIAARRAEEGKRAAQVLGANNPTCLNGQEGDVFLQPWLANQLKSVLTEKKYSHIFCPWPYDLQSDHSATFRIFQKAMGLSNVTSEVWLYEVWAPLLANRVVNIDSVIQKKTDAINAHQSQVSNINYTEKFLALAQYRSLICRPGKYAEAFFTCTPTFLAQMPSPQHETTRVETQNKAA